MKRWRSSYRTASWLLRKRNGLLKKFAKIHPAINGSILLMARRCGNAKRGNCHCLKGPKHISSYLTYAVKGKPHILYIPVGLERDVRQWSLEYRRIKELIRQLCEVQREIVRNHGKQNGRRKGKKHN